MRMVKSLLAIMMVVALALPVAALATDPKVVGTGPVSTFPDSDTPVLYDQLATPDGDATTAQNFEPAFDGYDNRLADDFIVPAGPGWDIDRVLFDGIYFNGFGPVVSVNVWIYGDSNCLKAGAPVYTGPGLPYVDPTGAGDLEVAISPPCLAPGHYWLVVQANMDFGVGGQWGWANNFDPHFCPAIWENPGGAFGIGCTTWSPRAAVCGIDPIAPDQCFRLNGVPCQTTAVEASTWGRIKANYPANP